MTALSPRQVEVMRFVSEGYSNKEIARKLGVSDKTVEQHMKTIFLKMNARNRAHAAVMFSRSAA